MSRNLLICLSLTGCALAFLLINPAVRSPEKTESIDRTANRSLTKPIPHPRISQPADADTSRGFSQSASADSQDSNPSDDNPTEESRTSNQAAAALPAVRLSDRFRLPAAAMALGTSMGNAGREPSPEVKSAASHIVDQFYLDIAGNASDRMSSGGSLHLEDTPDGSTVVVEPDGETSAIRENSDEIYRVLYGDAAYNRNLLHSAIEVTLPVSSAAGTGSGN